MNIMMKLMYVIYVNGNAIIIAILNVNYGDTGSKSETNEGKRISRYVTMLKCSRGIGPINGKPTLGMVRALIFEAY